MTTPARIILLDTNLLLLMAAGGFDRSLIGKRRLDIFDLHAFDLLLRVTAGVRVRLTTPHVLAEMNNLIKQVVPVRQHRQLHIYLDGFIADHEEVWTQANVLSKTPAFGPLGLTDAAIAELAAGEVHVFSIDLPLCRHLWGQSVNVTNFNHLLDVE